jgi:hypothetical protein
MSKTGLTVITKPQTKLARTLTGRLILAGLKEQQRLAAAEVARLRGELADALTVLTLTDRAVASIRAA